MSPQPIGKIVRIRRYPVKSLAGHDIDSAYVHETGINGDRIYAIYDKNSQRAGLPYITVRELPGMLQWQATIKDEKYTDQPYPHRYHPEVEVEHEGQTFSLDDESILNYVKSHMTEYHQDLVIDFRKAGIHDTKPLSLVSMQSIRKLSEESGVEDLDPLRFRSNFYVEWTDSKPFFEEELVGKSLRLGDNVVIHIVQSNVRCTIINVDPTSSEKNSHVLKTVSKLRDSKFGIYGEIRSLGTVNNGDLVYLLD